MKRLHASDFPLEFTDDSALFQMDLNNMETRALFLVGKRENLNLEKLTRKGLREIYSDYGIRNLSIDEYVVTGAPNYCAIRTTDHLASSKFHTIEHLHREVDEMGVVWNDGDFFFDIDG